MIKEKKNLLLIIGIVLVLIGTLLPAIRIAQENISFIKENGIITIILVLIMFILLKLDKKVFIAVPSILSLAVILKFVMSNINRLNQINKIYNCYAKFQYGIMIMILGNIIILSILTKENIKIESIKQKIITKKQQHNVNRIEKLKEEKERKIKQIEKHKTKQLTPSIIEKLSKKQDKKKILTETTKDGKIKYNKIIVKVNNNKKQSLKERISNLLLKLRLRRISKKNLSISKYKEEKITRTYYIPSINIRKWTRSNISCSNCGATINSNSEYCFLCDCKIKLSEKEEKIS